MGLVNYNFVMDCDIVTKLGRHMQITLGRLLRKFEIIGMVDSKDIRKGHILFDHPLYR